MKTKESETVVIAYLKVSVTNGMTSIRFENQDGSPLRITDEPFPPMAEGNTFRCGPLRMVVQTTKR